jgi:hypothetical protein
MNFSDYIKTKLPNPFFNAKWLEKLVNVNFYPFDISLQVLDYLPRLRDSRQVSPKDLKHLGYEKNMPEYYGEIDYPGRLKEAFNIWKNAGSRYGLNLTIKSCGFIPDETVFEYGIEERVDNFLPNDGYAIWADGDLPDRNRALLWGHFYWPETDGYTEIDSYGTYTVYISDPDESIYNEGFKTSSLFKICEKFAPANIHCGAIYLTDGSGTILHTITNE